MNDETSGRGGELRHGILGVFDALAQSVALLSLALGVAFASSAAAAYTGPTVPLAYLIAGVGSLCLGSVIIRFTRRMASAGGLYTYIARGLDPRTGFLGGWLYGGGFAVGISFVLVIGSFFLSVFFDAHTHVHLGWFACFWILLGLLALIAFLDVRISTRVQLAFALVGVAAILVLALVVLAKGGDSGVTLQPFNPSKATSTNYLFLAVVLAFTGFIGFEAAAVLGEETAAPLRAIPRAILAAVLVALVYYVFVTWAMSVGYGVKNASKWAQDPAALDTLAHRYVGNWLAVIIDLAVAASGFIAALGGLHLTSRTLYAMGREGGLPRAFAWTHPRFRTPWVGIATSLVITLLLGVLVAHRHNFGPITYFVFMATTATIGILITYILVAISGIVFFRRRTGTGAYNWFLDLIVPLAAIAICGYTLWKTLRPTPPYHSPVTWAPWLGLAWLGLGTVAALWIQATRPSRVATFGSILGASE
ncbi:MAG TPA: APC family permease [Gaiellaceae bacterium]|nr:APC family permease [Gaiellaceae bacterium]